MRFAFHLIYKVHGLCQTKQLSEFHEIAKKSRHSNHSFIHTMYLFSFLTLSKISSKLKPLKYAMESSNTAHDYTENGQRETFGKEMGLILPEHAESNNSPIF